MKDTELLEVIGKLTVHLEKRKYKGYDPYDALNMNFPWEKLPRFFPIAAIQFLKRFPVNIRPLLGIKKEYNPKAMGLFLMAYIKLYRKTGEQEYLDKAHFFFQWLYNNRSDTYKGISWGYNFLWVSPIRFLKPFTPSTVVTGFISRAIFEYYNVTADKQAKECLLGASEFVLKEIPVYSDDTGISFSYTPLQTEVCYNASLLAAEILAYAYSVKQDPEIREKILKACSFVTARQKNDGSWLYSMNIKTGEERDQIDFHQGYVLESLSIIQDKLGDDEYRFEEEIRKGIYFYFKEQFFENGRSKFRLPKKMPADIHHQAQGIITFSRFAYLEKDYSTFARKIAAWTIKHMRSGKGYFFFRKGFLITNRMNYIRWGQAWMLLALAEAIET